jgi:hypothetical protein
VRTTDPNAIDGEQSTRAQAVSTGSSSGTRTWGVPTRAVSGQSIQRTSSPGSYPRVTVGSPPGPGRRPRRSPCRTPSSRWPMRSSTRRSRLSGEAATGAAGAAGTGTVVVTS